MVTIRNDLHRLVEESRVRAIARSIMANIAVFGVLAYGYTTIFGLVRGSAFYVESGINPFAFYHLQDFLMAGARRGGGLLMPLLVASALVIWGFLIAATTTLFLSLTRRFMQRFQPDGKWDLIGPLLQAGLNRMIFGSMYVGALVCLPLYLLAVPLAAFSLSQDMGCTPVMHITLKSEGASPVAAIETLDRVIIDGAEDYLFVRDPSTKAYGVISLDAVRLVVPKADSGRRSHACLLLL